jgi:ribulose-5-phosphate 4-epimerase/fuculose-1-phosphate aldolase
VNDEAFLREEICRVGRSLFDRGYVHATAGNISVRLADGFLITPTDACLGQLDPARLARVDAAGQQTGGDRASKTLALHRRIYEAAPDAACVIHTHSTNLVALDPGRRVARRRHPAAHHALLRDEGGPRAAHPLPPPG